MHKPKQKHMIYFNENISMYEKGKTPTRGSIMMNSNFAPSMALDRKGDWDAKTATCEFSSDDRERSSADEDDDDDDCMSSTCTLCTSGFSFCNASPETFR